MSIPIPAPVTLEMAERAIVLAVPTIQAMMHDGIAKRTHGHLIFNYKEGEVDRRFGDKLEWEHPYDIIAEDKFDLTLEHEMSTRELHATLTEEEIQALSTPYKGSAYNKEYGIAVAFSGVDEHIDEVIAEIVLAILVGLVRDAEIKEKAGSN